MATSRLILALACTVAALLAAAPAGADVVDDNPAVAAQGAGDMRAFIRGTDGALWTRAWNGSNWSAWTSLGGSLTSGPAAAARPGGIYDVVARGPDGAYYHRAFTPQGGWTDFASLGGGFLSAPSVTYRQGTGQIDVIGVGLDRQLFHKAYESTGWTGWNPLGGTITAAPSIISPGPEHLEIYARGTDKQLYEKYWTPGTSWSEYIPLGGELTSGVAATAWDANRRDIFARASDGRIHIRSFTSPGGWSLWAVLGGVPRSGPGATAPAPNRLFVFTRYRETVSYRAFNSVWSDWTSFGFAPLYTPPAPPSPGPPPASGSPSLQLRAGFGCIPQGGRVPVRVRIMQRAGRLRPIVRRVVFFIDRGKRRRVDRRAPYKTRIRVTYRPGSKHRIHARIYFRRKGSRKIQRKTVSKRFVMCK